MNQQDSIALAALESQLQSQLGSRIRDLRLAPRHEGFVLQGYTHTYYAKQLAQHVVRDLPGVRMLANEIHVIQLPVSRARRR